MTMRKILSAFAGCAALLAAVAASADRHDDGETVHAQLVGWNETPAIVTDGTAVFRARIADNDLSFDWQLTYSFPASTSVSQSHIHIGQRNVAGGIVIWFCANNPPITNAPAGTQPCPTSAGTVSGTATSANVVNLPAQGVAAGEFAKVLEAIRRGDAYANIHTVAHPPGEIRGQISHGH
jgi:CHRD domain